MESVQDTSEIISETPEVTIESLAYRIDMMGAQMNWLCENMQGLFQFINQMGSSGGGIRGLMSALKNGGPEVTTNAPSIDTNKVEVNDA